MKTILEIHVEISVKILKLAQEMVFVLQMDLVFAQKTTLEISVKFLANHQ